MQITSATFVKSIMGTDEILAGGLPKIAFIGRSNVGKSSLINSLTRQTGLAITSSSPGRTRAINLFLINNSLHLLDLPGYGFARAGHKVREQFLKLINWYLFESPYQQKKVVLIIDAKVGLTDNDQAMLHNLEVFKKDVVVVANKIDKIKKSKYTEQLLEIKNLVGGHKIIPYSSYDKIGVKALTGEIFD